MAGMKIDPTRGLKIDPSAGPFKVDPPGAAQSIFPLEINNQGPTYRPALSTHSGALKITPRDLKMNPYGALK